MADTGLDESLEDRLERVRSRRRSFRPGSGADSSFLSSGRSASGLTSGALLDTSGAAGMDETGRVRRFQQLQEQALSSLEVSSLPSQPDGSGGGSRVFAAKSATSFLAGGAAGLEQDTSSSKGVAYEMLEKKYWKAKDKAELLNFQVWYRDQRDVLLATEYQARQQLMCTINSALHTAALNMNERAKQSLAEVAALRATYEDPSHRLLQLLGVNEKAAASLGLSDDAAADKRKKAVMKEVERQHPEGSQQQQDLPLDDVASCLMLETYAKHRDDRESELKERAKTLAAQLAEVHNSLSERDGDIEALNRRLEQESEARSAEQERHRKNVVEFKAKIAEAEDGKHTIINSIGEYESEIKELRVQLEQSTTAEWDVLQACKEGEARALAILNQQHEMDRKQWTKEISRLQKKVDHYMQKCASMETIQQECLRGRAMIQSELLELQDTRRAVAHRCEATVEEMKLAQTVEKLQSEKDRQELKRMKAIAQQQASILSTLSASPQPELRKSGAKGYPTQGATNVHVQRSLAAPPTAPPPPPPNSGGGLGAEPGAPAQEERRQNELAVLAAAFEGNPPATAEAPLLPLEL